MSQNFGSLDLKSGISTGVSQDFGSPELKDNDPTKVFLVLNGTMPLDGSKRIYDPTIQSS